MILELDRNLEHYADVIKRTLRVDVKRSPEPVPQVAWGRR